MALPNLSTLATRFSRLIALLLRTPITQVFAPPPLCELPSWNKEKLSFFYTKPLRYFTTKAHMQPSPPAPYPPPSHLPQFCPLW